MKQTPLKRRSKPRRSQAEVQAAEVFKAAVGSDPCAVCGGSEGWLHAHHVVYQQHLPDALRWDTRNALAVCHDCHHNHHHGGVRIPLEVLTDANVQFAREVLGDYADDYLSRTYTTGPEASSIVPDINRPGSA